MTASCPHCAEMRETVALYRRTLLGADWAAPAELGLTGNEERILRMLVHRERTNRDQLMLGLYGSDVERDPHVISVFLCHLRAKLRPYGIAIHHRFAGDYWLDQADRARLREWSAA